MTLKKSQHTNKQPIMYGSIMAPILSITIMVLGMGALTTFTTLRLYTFNCPAWVIGLVSAAFFIGLAIGGYKSQYIVLRVGHIRAYAAFSATFAVMALLQGLFEYPWLWVLLRFIAGFCLAGCFLVIECWLLGCSTKDNRGTILAIYMISYYIWQGVSQLFLKIPDLPAINVYIICAIFVNLSLLPVLTTKFAAPYSEEPNILSLKVLNKKVPVAVWGSLASGFILSVIYSLYPLYLSYLSWDQGSVATFMAAILVGATISQYPIGWLSDRYDRRIIISGVMVGFLVTSSIIIFCNLDFYGVLCYSFFVGFFSFTIYPLSVNYGIDSFSSKDLISATAAMILLYGVGSITGPSTVSLAMNIFGHNAYILISSLLAFGFLVFVIHNILKFKPIAEDNILKSEYSPLPDTTIEVVNLDAKGEEYR